MSGCSFADSFFSAQVRLLFSRCSPFDEDDGCCEGVRDGAVLLGAGAALVGGAFLFAFDATFTAAHQLLFPAGTWTFNPATDRLVQLYPETFWVAQRSDSVPC